MALHKHIFVVTLILALSLSSTDVSQATRHFLDTPAIPTTNLALSVIPSDLPMLHAQHPFLVQPKTTFPPFHPLSEVSTQPTLTNSSFPILSSTQTPSQPKLPKTTRPQLPTNHLPLLPGTQIPSTSTLPQLPSTQIPSMPTEPTMSNSTLQLHQAQLLAHSTLTNMPTDPKVKLPSPAGSQLPNSPTTIPSISISPSKLPNIHLLTPLPSKLDTPAGPTADLALSVIPYDLPMMRAMHPKPTAAPFHSLREVLTQPTLTKSRWILLPAHRINQVKPWTPTLPLLP